MPHRDNPIELSDETEISDMDCPACGTHIDLLAQETVSQDWSEPKIIGHFRLISQVGVGGFGTV